MSAVHKPTYMSWKGAKQRCRDPKHKAYGRYGGRGITFSERWDSYAQFVADMGERPAGMTLDRRDNNLGYGPGNCQWATRAAQGRNRENNVRYEFRGEQLTLGEISDRVGIPAVNIRRRLERGWSLADATTRGSVVGLAPVESGIAQPKPRPVEVKEVAPPHPKPVPQPKVPARPRTAKERMMAAFLLHRAELEAAGLTADQIASRAFDPVSNEPRQTDAVLA